MGSLHDVRRDARVREEIATLAEAGIALPHSQELGVTPRQVADAVIVDREIPKTLEGSRVEAVVRAFGRPVLYIHNGRIDLPRSKELLARLLSARGHLEARIPSVGRIEFRGHPQLPWGGTGWMVGNGVIVTNRHVASLFARRSGQRYALRTDPVTGQAISARIDFREEDAPRGRRPPSFEVAVSKVLFIEPDSRTRADIAFLALETDAHLPDPIPVLDEDLEPDADVAVVGYPAPDPAGVPSEAAARRIFHNRYGIKRLAPGKVMVSDPGSFYFTHDATTLGGNSGSVVLDMETGAAAGLHFAGRLGRENYAVKATALRSAIEDALPKARRPRRRVLSRVRRPVLRAAVEEAAPADYADRTGYDPAFLGSRRRVDLPVLQKRKTDLLTYADPSGKKRGDLPYTHFSLAMSKSRKLCLWSAVNIDGETSKPDPRPTKWLIDPRIPRTAQTLPDDHNSELDVYGNAPRFARGHMTRREDPIWGPAAHAGNLDSMHYTNVVPQMQSFNGAIWNNLEDYALKNARKDHQKISVITGPILTSRDKVMFGTKIPLEFWKVIAFVHDETGKLTATGYRISQESDLPHEEFVFGDFDGTHQVQLSEIERLTGLSFGTLSSRDPLHRVEAIPQPLMALEQIRFS
jgi:endonuclease G, mitochondrial